MIFGGGFNDEAITEIRQASQDVSNVPWLRPNMEGLKPPAPGEEVAYGEKIAKRVKTLLEELNAKGDMDKDGVYLY